MAQSSKRSGVFDATRKILVNGASVSAMIVHGACLAQPERKHDFHYYDEGGKVPVSAWDGAPA